MTRRVFRGFLETSQQQPACCLSWIDTRKVNGARALQDQLAGASIVGEAGLDHGRVRFKFNFEPFSYAERVMHSSVVPGTKLCLDGHLVAAVATAQLLPLLIAESLKIDWIGGGPN